MLCTHLYPSASWIAGILHPYMCQQASDLQNLWPLTMQAERSQIRGLRLPNIIVLHTDFHIFHPSFCWSVKAAHQHLSRSHQCIQKDPSEALLQQPENDAERVLPSEQVCVHRASWHMAICMLIGLRGAAHACAGHYNKWRLHAGLSIRRLPGRRASAAGHPPIPPGQHCKPPFSHQVTG